MELKKFIGKVVQSIISKRRFVLTEITATVIRARGEKPNSRGRYDNYSWDTINGNPFSLGHLVFEEASLTEAFIKAFENYCNSLKGRWERYEHFYMCWD